MSSCLQLIQHLNTDSDFGTKIDHISFVTKNQWNWIDHIFFFKVTTILLKLNA